MSGDKTKEVIWASTNVKEKKWCVGFTSDSRKAYGDEKCIAFTDGEAVIVFSRGEWEQVLKMAKKKWFEDISRSQNSTKRR